MTKSLLVPLRTLLMSWSMPHDVVRTRASVWFLLIGVLTIGAPSAAGQRPDARGVQAVADELKGELGIPQAVVVTLVATNPLMMSVKAPEQASDPFHLSIEESFLDELTTDELRAAIAHELGHVWVFTHHPYLQTEQLANQIAMRVVHRTDLVRVYEKVWQRGGTKGDLARFLGAQPATDGVAALGGTQPSRSTTD